MARFPQTLVITENSAQSGNATTYPTQLRKLQTKKLGDDMTHSARVPTKSVSGPTP